MFGPKVCIVFGVCCMNIFCSVQCPSIRIVRHIIEKYIAHKTMHTPNKMCCHASEVSHTMQTAEVCTQPKRPAPEIYTQFYKYLARSVHSLISIIIEVQIFGCFTGHHSTIKNMVNGPKKSLVNNHFSISQASGNLFLKRTFFKKLNSILGNR